MKQILMILFPPDAYLWAMAAVMLLLTLALLWLCRRARRRWWRLPALLLIVLGWYVLVYGTFFGVSDIKVRQVEFASADLPAAFDGYRIVHFGDAHVGSFNGWRESILSRAVDSINAQHPDLIVFTGDLQNKVPDEIESHLGQLRRLKAPDGVFSVMGNHDYPLYSDRDDFQKTADLGRTMSAEQEMGWYLLNNTWRRIRRNQQSIVIAGMENDGEGRFPQLGNVASALTGLRRESFVVMLEHDPTSWRRKILPHSHCQLTLSGHTHGGQLSLFEWSPAGLRFREHSGMYYAGQRAINVTTGIGGVVPFRFGTPPEIVVITLRSKR